MYLRSACMAYSEHDGTYLQLGGNCGRSMYWYTRTSTIIAVFTHEKIWIDRMVILFSLYLYAPNACPQRLEALFYIFVSAVNLLDIENLARSLCV